MISSLFRARRPATRGFTLTEIAIVLGIIGIILGAIWAAAAMVYENNRTKEATEQTLAIINNWRSVYGSRRVDVTDTTGTTMTQLTVNNSFAPQEMLGCTNGGTPCLYGPWTGTTVAVLSSTTDNSVSVWYENISQTACNHLSNALSNAAGLLSLKIDGGSTTSFPPLGTSATLTTSEVSAACSKTDNTGSIIAEFSMN